MILIPVGLLDMIKEWLVFFPQINTLNKKKKYLSKENSSLPTKLAAVPLSLLREVEVQIWSGSIAMQVYPWLREDSQTSNGQWVQWERMEAQKIKFKHCIILPIQCNTCFFSPQ